MLPQKNRLKKKKDFEKVLREGKGYRDDCLYLKIKENNLKTSRFGFVVSKKVSSKAVIRNQLKRRLRELLRTDFKKIKKGFDGVIIAMSGLEIKDFWELETIINKLFKKANLFENSKR